MALNEHEIIASVSVYLLNEGNADIESIAVKRNSHRGFIKSKLQKNGISKKKIENITFNTKGTDINAYYEFDTGRIQRRMIIEAKGGTTHYNLYTALGQFICSKKSPSTYYWFGFAFPYSWREKTRERLTNGGEINPIINLLLDEYTKNGQGLYFYFVKENGETTKETWRQTLRS
ncbi:MAG: hypothetical protein ACOCSL_03595 [Thermoplasmatota archaeon]